jgi:hypothetical protein
MRSDGHVIDIRDLTKRYGDTLSVRIFRWE